MNEVNIMATPQTEQQQKAFLRAMQDKGDDLLMLEEDVRMQSTIIDALQDEIDRLHSESFKIRAALFIVLGFACYFAYLLIW